MSLFSQFAFATATAERPARVLDRVEETFREQPSREQPSTPLPAERLTLTSWLVPALAFGLLTGLTEYAIQGWLFPLRRPTAWHYTPDMIWAAPLADLLLLLPWGLAIAGLAWLVPRPFPKHVCMGLLSFPACLTPPLMEPRIARWAAALLAVGMAVQIANLSRKRPVLFQRLATAGLILGLAGVSVGTGITYGAHWFRASHVAAVPVEASQSPNVLFITLDTVRAESLSLYGNEHRTTPHLDAFAQEGVVFDRAWSTSPWTLPSHATMFTGLYPEQHQSDWNIPLNERFPTLAAEFREAGYQTAGFIANQYYCGWNTGLQHGFVDYDDHDLNVRWILASSRIWRGVLGRLLGNVVTGRDAEHMNALFLDWLNARDAERPFFAFVNYIDAHQPYVVGPPYDTMFDGPSTVPPGDDPLMYSRNLYKGCIASLDAQLGKLFAELEARGILDQTLVVIAGDHGEMFGERDELYEHGNALFSQVLHVPLVMRLPGTVPAGRRIPDVVTLRDLARTVEDLAHPDDAPTFPGTSLAKFWNADSNVDRPVAASPVLAQVSGGIRIPAKCRNHAGAIESIVVDDYHLIEHSDPRFGTELYDLKSDPRELENLADHPDLDDIIQRCRRAMETARH